MSETELATTDTNATESSQPAPSEAAPVLGGEGTPTPAAEPEVAKAEPEPAKTEDTKPKAEDEKPKGKELPETYEFKAPDGTALDETLVGEFTPLAKELGLDQENAQKAVDFYASKILPRVEAARAEAWAQTQADWAKAAKADAEIGGDAFDSNIAVANSAVDRFGGPELAKALKETGAGNHPAVVKAFLRIGKAIADDRIETGAQGGGSRSPADVLYPTMKS